LKDNNRLDGTAARPGYTVFGKVIDGMDVVDKIAQARTGAKVAHTLQGRTTFTDVPEEEIVIKRVRKTDK
jgi:cyclophilin family peptidyl-prolyl cis-trans isomerase